VLIVFPQLLTTGEIVRDVSRKDSRTVAGEWVLKHLKGGEEIAVTEEPWQFEMPPMDRKRYRIAVCGYDAGALLRGGAKVFVYSDLQSDPGVNPHRDVLGEAEFWNELKQGSVAEVFELAFVAPVPRDVRKYYSALGLWKAQPEDLRYVSPRVVVLRRKKKGRAGAPD